MRTNASLLIGILVVASMVAYPASTQWPRFLKVRPWDLDSEVVPFPNYSNEDPSRIREFVAAADPSHTAVQRMVIALQAIGSLPNLHPEQRALLARDALDAITGLHPNWRAYDTPAKNAVLFYGGFNDGQNRFAIAISLLNGRFYKGIIDCSILLIDEPELRLDDLDRWRVL